VRIERFRIANYKSFADSGEVRFKPGFNVIWQRAAPLRLTFRDVPECRPA
jgi:hypothetical protein